MTAALIGHNFPEWNPVRPSNSLACTECGLKVWVVVHAGQLFIAHPIPAECPSPKRF